jgi:hypothetical protein
LIGEDLPRDFHNRGIHKMGSDGSLRSGGWRRHDCGWWRDGFNGGYFRGGTEVFG